jgi:hypothetical protein
VASVDAVMHETINAMFTVYAVTQKAILVSDTTAGGLKYRIVVNDNTLFDKLAKSLSPDRTFPLIFEYDTLFLAKKDFTAACLFL